MKTADAILHNWEDIPYEQLNSNISRKLITGSNMMIAHIYLKKGGTVPMHNHHNEQITYVLDGALKFLLGEDQAEEIIVHAGEVRSWTNSPV